MIAIPMIGAAVMALVLLGFRRQYEKSYLQHWTLAWAALAINDVAASVPGHTAGVIGGISGGVAIAWIAFGVWELVRRRPVRLQTRQWILLGAVVCGAATVFLPIVRTVAAGITYAVSGIAIWRARRRQSGIGFNVLGAALFAFGVAGESQAGFLLQSLVGVGMIACLLEDEREAAELASAQIEHLAYHDALTGLPNRPLFIDRLVMSLAQSNRANTRLAVLFLDLDRFKDINDSLGHSLGDSLLKAVAERIRRCVREGDTVARFGGDEFTLLIPRIDNIEDAAKIAQKIIETLKIPFVIHERELFVTTSIGVSIFPTDGIDPETLVRNADTAMYRAKEQGRDNYQLYAPAMNARALERLALENMLRKAITQKELLLHYQPLIDARSGAVTGVEALIRWNHPQLGMLVPAHFISVAELSGLILPIGQWVLTTACRQVRTWERRIGRELVVSVNLSARQFSQPDLVEQIRAAVNETGIAPASLQLEITESNAMQNAENSMYTLRELKNLGVRIAMDDFGTGYSSLNYLKRFPIDTLKLDRSFVNDVTTDASDAAIVSAVIVMAHSLDLKVVAEGVETEEQLAFLREHEVDVFQGYLFGAPMTPEQIEAMLVDVGQPLRLSAAAGVPSGRWTS